MARALNIGMIGCGTIGGFVLDRLRSENDDSYRVEVVCGRSEQSKGRDKVKKYGIAWVTDFREMLDRDLNLVIEAASHKALEAYGCDILKAGIDLIPVSIGSLVSNQLHEQLKRSAAEGASILHLPSGGIGGLDAIQAAVHAGVEEISLTSRKPPAAWKGIPYVEQMNLDLDHMDRATLLYDGTARDCVKKFPQNINVAAALSLAGIGFDKTRIRIFADPDVTHNTHEIECSGEAGHFTVKLENLPAPDNPKTSYLASLSTLAAVKNIRSSYRIGT